MEVNSVLVVGIGTVIVQQFFTLITHRRNRRYDIEDRAAMRRYDIEDRAAARLFNAETAHALDLKVAADAAALKLLLEQRAQVVARALEKHASEIKIQVADMGTKADAAYHEANQVNLWRSEVTDASKEQVEKQIEQMTRIEDMGEETNKVVKCLDCRGKIPR